MKFENNETIGIYVLSEDNCYEDEKTPELLQKNYFEDRLIHERHYRFYENLPAISQKRIKKANISKFLFRYKGYIVACGMIDNTNDFYFEDKNIDKNENKFNKYLQLKSVKTFPVFSFNDIKDDIFNFNWNNELSSRGRRGSGNGAVLKIKNADLLNKYITKKYSKKVIDISELKEVYNKYQTTCILKEINYYNNEDAHSFFLANFLKEDNSYGLGNKPFKAFLKMIGEDYDNIDNLNVYPQKSFKVKVSDKINNIKKARPDITITYTCNNKKKMIIIESKINADENMYGKVYQTDLYYKYLLNDELTNGYSLSKIVMLKVNTKEDQREKDYIKYVDYQDLIDYIYYPLLNKVKYNKGILEDYFKTFWFTVDASEFYKFNISLIPDTKTFNGEYTLFESILNYIRKCDCDNIAPIFENDCQALVFKYLLALMYKDKDNSKETKELIRRVYSSL